MGNIGKLLAKLVVLTELPLTHSWLDFHVQTLELVESRWGCNALASYSHEDNLCSRKYFKLLLSILIWKCLFMRYGC